MKNAGDVWGSGFGLEGSGLRGLGFRVFCIA